MFLVESPSSTTNIVIEMASSLRDSMPLFDECFGTTYLDEIIVLTLNIIVLIVTCYLAYRMRVYISSTPSPKSPLSSPKNKNMNGALVALYFTALIGTALSMSGSFASIILCPWTGKQTMIRMLLCTVYLGFVLLFTSLVGSFELRLHITFADSGDLAVSKKQRVFVLISVLIIDISALTSGILFCFDIINAPLFWICSLITFGIFVMISIVPVFQFIHNLMWIANYEATHLSQSDLRPDKSVTDQQEQWINLSSRYASLFILAIATSMLIIPTTAIFHLYLQTHPGCLWSIDCLINIVCLHLNQGYASKQYKKYCWRFHSCCRGKFRARIRNKNKMAITAHKMVNGAKLQQTVHSNSVRPGWVLKEEGLQSVERIIISGQMNQVNSSADTIP